jgi:hypothetical protein
MSLDAFAPPEHLLEASSAGRTHRPPGPGEASGAYPRDQEALRR